MHVCEYLLHRILSTSDKNVEKRGKFSFMSISKVWFFTITIFMKLHVVFHYNDFHETPCGFFHYNDFH